MLSAYVAEAEALLASLRPRVDALDVLPSQRAAASRAIDADLSQLEGLGRLLDMELRRGEGGPDLARGRAVLSEIKTLKERKQKSDVLAHEGAEGSDTRNYHTRFKNTTSRLQASSEILQESRRNIVDTEAVASGIAEKLLENRQTIESAHSKLMETGGLLGRAHRAMRSMQQRETQRKLALLAAVLFVVCLLIWAAVSLVSGGGNGSPPPTQPAGGGCLVGQSVPCGASSNNQTEVIGPACPGCCCLAGLRPSGRCGCT